MSRYAVVVFLLLLVAAPILVSEQAGSNRAGPQQVAENQLLDPASPTVRPSFREAVYGDVLMVGNSVLRCPQGGEIAGDASAADCLAATEGTRSAAGNNNSYYMHLAKDDGRADSFDSSSAELTVPAGATVRYAQLNWGGHTGTYIGFSGVNCIRPLLLQGEPPPPPAAPSAAEQQPRIAVAGGRPMPVTRDPQHFTTTNGLSEASQIYTDWADVTTAFAGVATGRQITLSVSNVWAPTGPGCAGGWSVQVVFDHGQPTASHTSPRVIDIYTKDLPRSAALLPGLLEPLLPGLLSPVTDLLPGLAPSLTGTSVTLPGVSRQRSAAAPVIGVTAFDGDWGQGGEILSVDGVAMTEPCYGNATTDFFRSCAAGAIDPSDPARRPINNLSVDVKAVAPALPDNDTGDIRIGVSSVGDFVVLQSVVLAETVTPSVSLTMTPPSQSVDQGDLATFDLLIQNDGSLPLRDLDLTMVTPDDGNDDTEDDGIRCTPSALPTLEPGRSTQVSCIQPARVDHAFTTRATVTATYLAGTLGRPGTVSATAESRVDVVPADYTVERVPDRLVVREGGEVTFTVRLTNNTTTDLTAFSYVDGADPDCVAPPPPLSPGAPLVFTCVATASETFTSSGRLSWDDGQSFQDSQPVIVTVIHPEVTVSTTVDKDTVYLGDTVELTFTVGNAGTQPDERLTDIAVSVPEVCAAPPIPALDPGASTEVTCTARPTRAGPWSLRAGAEAADVNNDPVTGLAEPVMVTVLEPLISLTQEVDRSTVRVGDEITVTFTVEHVGSADDGPVTNVALSSPTLPDCQPEPVTQLDPGETATFECTASPDRTFDNQAVAAATDQVNRLMRVTTQPLRVTVINPALTISTTAEPEQAMHSQNVDFALTVRNIGDVPMTVDVTNDEASDCDFTLDGQGLRAGAAHGVRCTMTTPTQEDTTELTNTATYTATPLASTGDTGEPLTGADDATITLTPGQAPPEPAPGTDPVTGGGGVGGGTIGAGNSSGSAAQTPGGNTGGQAAQNGGLPDTGVSLTVPLGVGTALVLLGLLALAATSRRRDDENSFLYRWWPGN